MGNEYLVSIIMPVYKVRPYIKDSVLSVINQTYKNIEFILVDNGDPDRSWEIAEDILKEKDYPYQIIHQENAGQGWARNAGMNAAKGDYVYFLDSDDIILSETIERMASAIQNQYDMVICEHKGITDKKEITEVYNDAKPELLDRKQILDDFLVRRKQLIAPGTLYNMAFLKQNDLTFKKIPWSEDQHFIWRTLAKCSSVVYLDEKLYQYLFHENSIMRATPAEKIAISYPEIKKLNTVFVDAKFGNWVVSRWAVGSIGASCRFLEYREWEILYDQLEGRKNFKQLHDFPDAKTRIVSYMGQYLPYMFYKINKARIK